jgi:hypothetical protein
LVENAIRLNVDKLLSRCGIGRGGAARGKYNFDFDDQDLWIDFECHINHPGESWLRLQYQICDYWTGEPHDIDELIYLVATRPPFGGLRWWFVCPRTNRRVRMLYLPLGARRFGLRQGARRRVRPLVVCSSTPPPQVRWGTKACWMKARLRRSRGSCGETDAHSTITSTLGNPVHRPLFCSLCRVQSPTPLCVGHARPTQLPPGDGSSSTLQLGCSENPCVASSEIRKQIKGCIVIC